MKLSRTYFEVLLGFLRRLLSGAFMVFAWTGALIGFVMLVALIGSISTVTVVNSTGAPTRGGFLDNDGDVRRLRALAPGARQTLIFRPAENGFSTGVRLASGRIVYGGGEGYLTLLDLFIHRIYRVTADAEEYRSDRLPEGFK